MRSVKARRQVEAGMVCARRTRGGMAAGAPVSRRAGGVGAQIAPARLLAAFAAVSVVPLTALLPEAALAACPVCFDANEENRMAFLATTGLLTLLPLGMVAGFGVWLRKRARELGGGGESERGSDAMRRWRDDGAVGEATDE